MQITKETIIGDILDTDFEVAPFFLEIGMHCLGCPASRGESIEEACAVTAPMQTLSWLSSTITSLTRRNSYGVPHSGTLFFWEVHYA